MECISPIQQRMIEISLKIYLMKWMKRSVVQTQVVHLLVLTVALKSKMYQRDITTGEPYLNWFMEHSLVICDF